MKEAYRIVSDFPTSNVRKILRNIAAQEYDDLLERAKTDADVAAYCRQKNIGPGTRRSLDEISNDVRALNAVVGMLNVATTNIERLKVEHSSDWLIENGMNTGNGRDVASGINVKMKLNNNFDERQAGYEDMAKTDISITADVSVVKSDRQKLSDEGKKRIRAKYGLDGDEVQDLLQKNDGAYETAPIEIDDESDYFVSAEEKINP